MIDDDGMIDRLSVFSFDLLYHRRLSNFVGIKKKQEDFRELNDVQTLVVGGKKHT